MAQSLPKACVTISGKLRRSRECRRIAYTNLLLKHVGLCIPRAAVRVANGAQAVNAVLYQAYLDVQDAGILIHMVIVAGGARSQGLGFPFPSHALRLFLAVCT